jgi:hypothetical protein
MWERRRLATLWAFTACYRVALPFISDLYRIHMNAKADGVVETAKDAFEKKTIRCQVWGCLDKFSFKLILYVLILFMRYADSCE